MERQGLRRHSHLPGVPSESVSPPHGGDMGETGGRRQEAIENRQEAGGRRQEAGGRRQEAGGRRQEAGGRRQEAEERRKEAGNRSQEVGGRRQETEDRRQEAGGRRQEAGGRRQETGGLLFFLFSFFGLIGGGVKSFLITIDIPFDGVIFISLFLAILLYNILDNNISNRLYLNQ